MNDGILDAELSTDKFRLRTVDAPVATMNIDVVEVVVAAGAIECDTSPLSIHAVVGQIRENFVGAVATEGDLLLQGTVANDFSMHTQVCFLMEAESGSLGNGEGDIWCHDEAVVYEVGTCR